MFLFWTLGSSHYPQILSLVHIIIQIASVLAYFVFYQKKLESCYIMLTVSPITFSFSDDGGDDGFDDDDFDKI